MSRVRTPSPAPSPPLAGRRRHSSRVAVARVAGSARPTRSDRRLALRYERISWTRSWVTSPLLNGHARPGPTTVHRVRAVSPHRGLGATLETEGSAFRAVRNRRLIAGSTSRIDEMAELVDPRVRRRVVGDPRRGRSDLARGTSGSGPSHRGGARSGVMTPHAGPAG